MCLQQNKTIQFYEKHYSLFLLLLFILINSCTKNKVSQSDFTKKQLFAYIDTASIIVEHSQPQAAFRFIDSVFRNKKLSDYDKYWIYNFKKRRFYGYDPNYDSAKIYCYKMLDLLKNQALNDSIKHLYSNVYFSLAEINYNEDSFHLAVAYFQKSFDNIEKNKNHNVIRNYFNRIGLAYFKQELYQEALINFKKSSEFFAPIEDGISENFSSQEILDNIGLTYFQLKQYDSARYYYHQALKNIEQNSIVFPGHNISWQEAKCVIYSNLGSLMIVNNQYDSVEYYFNKAVEIAIAHKYSNEYACNIKVKLFSFYVQQNNQEQANKTFKEVEDCIQQFSTEAIDYEKYLFSKSKYYALIGKPQAAYQTLLAYNKLFDSKIFNKHIATYSILTQNVKSYKDRLHIDELNVAAGKKTIIIIVLICIVVIISIYVYYKDKISRQLQNSLNTFKVINNELKTEKIKYLQLSEELKDKNVEKDFLMRGVLHDLLNPLTSLSLKVELLEFQYKKDLQSYFDFNYFKYSISNMVSICNDLLEFRDLKTITIKPETFNLIELINNITQQVQYQLNTKKQSIQLQYSDSFDANVYLDKTKIGRLLLNLIVNAMKFSPTLATITINIQDKNESFELNIIDQGIGMSEEMINRILKNNNIDGTLGTKGEKSFGLGLYICNRIVIAHQGKIEVTSEPGKGSTFTITLPKTFNANS